MKNYLSESPDQVSSIESLGYVQKVLEEAKTLGIDGAEIDVHIDSGFSVNVRMGELESIEHCFEKAVSVKVYVNQRSGVTSTSELSETALRASLEKAYHIAKLTNQDPCSGLPLKDHLAFDYPDLDLYHPWNISVPEAITLALEAEAKGLSYDARIANSEGVTLSSHKNHYLYANTLGFVGKYASTSHSFGCSLLAKMGEDMQRDDDYTVARNAKDLENFASVTQSAAKKAIARLNPRSLPSCKIPVLFSPQMAKGLLKSFLQAIRGPNLYRKSSFLLNQLGKQVFPKFMEIDQRPHLLNGLGSAPFDLDGVRTKPCFFIKNGILENYLLGTYSARRLNMENNGTAGGPYNLFVRGGDKDLQGLLKQMGRGLFVTDLIGHGINLTNGNYSRGAIGFLVEGGEIQYPVSGITIAGNLKNIFLKINAVGNDVDIRGNIKTGSILIDEMTVAGGS